MRIAVIGTGYVGLVAGTCFAETGNEVICVDIDEEKVKMLKQGESPIYEPGLTDLLKKNIRESRLEFSTDLTDSVKKSDVIFLAVGTPSSEDGSADLSVVLKVADDIGKAMNESKLIVNKSTVPVGTFKKVREHISQNTTHKFYVVSNPEFLKEGSAIDDFLRPDRVVIGTESDKAWDIMSDLYRPFVRQGNPIIRMTNISAEMTKYTANSMLATKISFINQIALLCDKVGADVESVRRGITTDVRIGRHFLYPGPGYGGSCFPKDVRALIKTGNENGIDLLLVKAAQDANEIQKKVIGNKILAKFGNDLTGKTIALWGLAFKPNTDDMREAPSLVLLKQLTEANATVQAFDPIARETAIAAIRAEGMDESKVKVTDSGFTALEGADALAIVTEWNDFRNPNFEKIKSIMRGNLIFDGRNTWRPDLVRSCGFEYVGIGRS